MRVIITGGSGLIGRELTASLAAANHEVIVLSRDPAQVTDLPQGARAELWDGRSANSWVGFAEGADAIVNLAGESIAGANPVAGRWNAARKQAIRQSRVNAGKAVVEAVKAARRKPGVVIQASAVGYYGPCGDEEVTEDHPAGGDFLARVCLDWEASSAAVEAMGVRRAIIRTGLLLSKKGGALRPLLMMFNLLLGGPLGDGRQWWPWIHIADEIAALRFVIDNPQARGAFNLSAPHPVTNKEFSRLLGKVMGRPSFMPAPAFALRLALGEVADALLLSGQRQVPRRLQQMGFSFKFPEAEGALRDLLP